MGWEEGRKELEDEEGGERAAEKEEGLTPALGNWGLPPSGLKPLQPGRPCASTFSP